MQIGIGKARLSSCLAIGLVAFACICLEGRDVMAQGPVVIQEREPCPLPAGEAPPADPAVTAQQVEDGSATLAEFAQAALRRFKGVDDVLTTQQLAYSGCRLRLEGGPWRSGSTYIVTLSADGRVYLHAKNMSLSAGKLQVPIYGQILLALGTPRRFCRGCAPWTTRPGTAQWTCSSTTC